MSVYSTFFLETFYGNVHNLHIFKGYCFCFYVINILQNLEEMSSNRPADKKQAMEALQNVLKFSGRLPEDFDADKELQEAREEKYGNIG